ncbi:MAG: nicotinate-nucleotide adenylyltransferase [Gammaproteobacteria bacterium]|nr:nicotinate-nucleotide adenylyltransferase [Gammaproteobacteria bacterium]
MTATGQRLPAPVGVLGGTFDPVHHGHLRCAFEVLVACGLESVRLVPAARPPHRHPPVAGAETRVRLLCAACAGEPRFQVDERELRRTGPSYTVDTLASLREEVGTRPICLLIGMDAFLGLPGWHRWRDLTGLAHLVVMHRPGAFLAPGEALAQMLATCRSEDVEDLRRTPSGVVRLQAVTPLDISSTAIRALLAEGGDPRYLVPDAVRDQLLKEGCYRQKAEVQVRA